MSPKLKTEFEWHRLLLVKHLHEIGEWKLVVVMIRWCLLIPRNFEKIRVGKGKSEKNVITIYLFY